MASPTGTGWEGGHHRIKSTHVPFLQAFRLKTQVFHFRDHHSLSLETRQCKISQLMTPDTPPPQICQQTLPAHIHLHCSFLFAPYCSSSLFSPHCIDTFSPKGQQFPPQWDLHKSQYLPTASPQQQHPVGSPDHHSQGISEVLP